MEKEGIIFIRQRYFDGNTQVEEDQPSMIETAASMESNKTSICSKDPQLERPHRMAREHPT